MAREPRLRRRGTGEAAEEAGALTSRSERCCMLGGQFIEGGLVELDSRARSRLRQALGGAGQAVRTVAARFGPRLAEVPDEGLHLAALVLDEGDDALDPLRLRLLAAVEA